MFCLMHVVDAFTSRQFSGNPAAVVELPFWIDDATLQSVAAQNNLSETVFVGPAADVAANADPSFDAGGCDFGLRWFTPEHEVDLCGHATLAAAHALTHEGRHPRRDVVFASHSGVLRVDLIDEGYELDFPSRPPAAAEAPDGLAEALGVDAGSITVLRGVRDTVAVLSDAETVARLTPDFAKLMKVDAYSVIATAPGPGADAGGDPDTPDFVSRFFVPREGINEDPVTGSAHCTLAPYWADRLGRNTLHARQVSARGGNIRCTMRGDRVGLAGDAVTYSWGQIRIPADRG